PTRNRAIAPSDPPSATARYCANVFIRLNRQGRQQHRVALGRNPSGKGIEPPSAPRAPRRKDLILFSLALLAHLAVQLNWRRFEATTSFRICTRNLRGVRTV